MAEEASTQETMHEEAVNERQAVDLAAEFSALGRKFAEAMTTVWESEERQRIEGEFREGFRQMGHEIDSALYRMRHPEGQSAAADAPAEKMAGEEQAADSGSFSAEMRTEFVSALKNLSDMLGRMADDISKEQVEEASKE